MVTTLRAQNRRLTAPERIARRPGSAVRPSRRSLPLPRGQRRRRPAGEELEAQGRGAGVPKEEGRREEGGATARARKRAAGQLLPATPHAGHEAPKAPPSEGHRGLPARGHPRAAAPPQSQVASASLPTWQVDHDALDAIAARLASVHGESLRPIAELVARAHAHLAPPG
ncbi:unnamed protein product, partial [Prorocentrum cordatum]